MLPYQIQQTILGSSQQQMPWVSYSLLEALIVWSFAIRFYAQNHLGFGVVRSAFYLLILICMNWISPFIFIAVEGRPRFFGTTEQ